MLTVYAAVVYTGLFVGVLAAVVDVACDNPFWELPVPRLVIPGYWTSAVALALAAEIQPDGGMPPVWALRAGAFVLLWSGWHRLWVKV